ILQRRDGPVISEAEQGSACEITPELSGTDGYFKQLRLTQMLGGIRRTGHEVGSMTTHHCDIDLELRLLLAAPRVHTDRDLRRRDQLQLANLGAQPIFEPLAADELVPLLKP